MSYQLRDVVRLHGRDVTFAAQYWRDKLSNQLQGKSPKSLVICNSFPKSGTHLLYQVLYSIPTLQKWDDIVSVQALCGIMNTVNHVRWKVGSAPDGSIVRSHLMYCDEVLGLLKELNCKVLFIYRDLRDVAVSHARWVTKEERIFLHPIYKQYASFDEQLMSSIKGVPLGTPFGSNLSQPDIGTDFSRWHGWVKDAEVLAVKFEDLVGERGGGSEEKRLYIVERILDYLNISLSSEQIKAQFGSRVLDPKESHTFKKGGKGRIGNWEAYFNESHKQAFKRVAGDLLVELGYENDLSW
ncbi:MAG: sulfotransferase domain-containing protein [Cyanobacteria bacterium P01_F01_bin.150]